MNTDKNTAKMVVHTYIIEEGITMMVIPQIIKLSRNIKGVTCCCQQLISCLLE